MAFRGDSLLISDTSDHRGGQVGAGADVKVTGSDDEVITTLAGDGTSGFAGDGAAPTTGPSGTFAGGSATATATTDASGVATAPRPHRQRYPSARWRFRWTNLQQMSPWPPLVALAGAAVASIGAGVVLRRRK